jgi:RimJ/RimL family protein N-acetyltransferase
MNVVLQTPRLLLRELSLGDLDFVATMLAHPEVIRFYPQTYSRADAEAWIRRSLTRYEKHGTAFWLAVEKSSGEPVGQVGLLHQLVEGVEEVEVAYLLHHPYWHRGYASEAAVGVRDHAFKALDRRHVVSLIRPMNRPSIAVALKIGMRPGKLTLHGGLEHVVYRVDRAG